MNRPLARAIPMALGYDPLHPRRQQPAALPFGIIINAGFGFLYMEGTGVAVTAALKAPQLRQLAADASAAAAALEQGSGENVVSIFTAGAPE